MQITVSPTIICVAASLALAAFAPHAAAQEVDPASFRRPTGAKMFTGTREALIEAGKRFWTSEKLGTNGQSCNSCHATIDTYAETFRGPYPHFVQIVKDKAGLDSVEAAEMVQFCVVVPLAGKPLDWASEELAALTAYVEYRQTLFAGLKR